MASVPSQDHQTALEEEVGGVKSYSLGAQLKLSKGISVVDMESKIGQD